MGLRCQVEENEALCLPIFVICFSEGSDMFFGIDMSTLWPQSDAIQGPSLTLHSGAVDTLFLEIQVDFGEIDLACCRIDGGTY